MRYTHVWHVTGLCDFANTLYTWYVILYTYTRYIHMHAQYVNYITIECGRVAEVRIGCMFA